MLYSDILKLAEMQGVQFSKQRSVGRQNPGRHFRNVLSKIIILSVGGHIANKIVERIVVPEERFLAQYLIPSRLM